MEKYGLVVPTDTGDYVAIERYNDLAEAENAFESCQLSGKALVRYDQIGPWSYIGVTIKE